MGVSFTFLPIFEASMRNICTEDFGDASCENGGGGTAYGKVLGTTALMAIIEVFMSFIPPKLLRKIIPNFVAGITVTLIGVSLIGTGIKYWGGGASCADNSGRGTVFGTGTFNETTQKFTPLEQINCGNNGDVELPFASAQYWGLGLLVMVTLVVVEIFGSPFLRNCNVIIGLAVGYIVAAATTVDGKRYVTSEKFDSAKVATFLWVDTFPLGFYWPAIIPLGIAYIVTTVESIGDISATMEASQMDIEHERIQGGLLADGIYSSISCLAMSMPNTTFSQNNGVISLTRCASRYAGIACGCWLFIMGVFGYIAAIISSIPEAVIGGMTTFLFCNVFISGIRIICSKPVTRRVRFIMAVSLGLGVGVAIVPGFGGLSQAGDRSGWGVANGNLWTPQTTDSDGLRSFKQAVIIALSTSYSIGTIVAVILNLILPHEEIPDEEAAVRTFESSHEGEEILKSAKQVEDDFVDVPPAQAT
eukprot:scaffold64_cov338-Pavlova_lutheri.AAC.16